MRKLIERALKVAGREIDERLFLDRRVVPARHARRITVLVHIADQPGNIGAGQVAL
jgi:hypothetical protein